MERNKAQGNPCEAMDPVLGICRHLGHVNQRCLLLFKLVVFSFYNSKVPK